jgi:hypothetical protein
VVFAGGQAPASGLDISLVAGHGGLLGGGLCR